MLWSDFLLSVSSVSCFGSLPFASDFLQWGSQAAKWELKLPNISWWVCSCCSCCDTARLGSSLPLRSFSQADPLLPAWDLCCAWWQIFSSSPCNFEWSYTLLHTLYKVKTMCQTWMILTTGYHQTQSPVPEQHRWQLPPKISTHILQELQLFHSYLYSYAFGVPIFNSFQLYTCNLLLHDFEGNEMRVRSAPLRHRVRHWFREAPRESGLSLKVFTKRSMQHDAKRKKGLWGQLGTWGHFCHCLDVPVWISWPRYEPQITCWWDVMFQHVGIRSVSLKTCMMSLVISHDSWCTSWVLRQSAQLILIPLCRSNPWHEWTLQL